ncbi:MAG: methyltransferase domain-containing protein [Deltaproteobacteria bacterium]|jgi:2-polyprenyl-3-methyl-5-hydroxy-6-metoxy-1,4-benzoquinol methylase
MNQENPPFYKGWEYAQKGDYHRNLDPNWSYTPTYLRKLHFVRKQIQNLGPDARILDAGCGEGVLVEEFRAQGYSIVGLDLNYESHAVCRGSILEIPYEDRAFDLVLLLDVLEHLNFLDQPVALAEIYRVLCQGGEFVASVPNLAHWNSRFRMALLGHLDRTDLDTNHIGERPYKENRHLIRTAGFQIVRTKGITLTVPLLYRGVICRRPAWFKWLHDLLDLFACPPLAMITLFFCRKV